MTGRRIRLSAMQLLPLRTRSSFANHAHGGSMNKMVCTLVTASVLVSGYVYGQNATKPAPAKQTKQQLRDAQMDKVTAAGEENSSIAANNSAVTTSATGTVGLAGSALMGASGVNIVSESDALVSGGVNVYDESGTGTTVNQSNVITQTEADQANLSDYHRGKNSQLSIDKTSNVTKNNSFASSLTTSLDTSTTDSKAYTN